MLKERVAADFAAVTSAGLAGVTWLADLGILLQLGATVVAIVAGGYAIQWHRFRLKAGREALDRQRRNDQIERTIKELDDR